MGIGGTHLISYKMCIGGTHQLSYTMYIGGTHRLSYKMVIGGTHRVSYTMGIGGTHRLSYKMCIGGTHRLSYKMIIGGTHRVSYTMGIGGTHPISYKMCIGGTHRVSLPDGTRALTQYPTQWVSKAITPGVKRHGTWRRRYHLVPRLRMSVPVTPRLTHVYGLHRDDFTFTELRRRICILSIQVFRASVSRLFEVRQCCLLQGKSTTFLRNIGYHSPNNTMSHCTSSHSQLIFKVHFDITSQFMTRTTKESHVTSGTRRNLSSPVFIPNLGTMHGSKAT
jgi:hypothetical protein